jgi:hypothetical protein
MLKYQVEINGRNFLINVDGHVARHGFFTFRFVEASDATSAEFLAVEMIRKAPHVRSVVMNVPDDPPLMDVTQVLELNSFEGIENLEPGFIWYSESPRRWWQFWRRD